MGERVENLFWGDLKQSYKARTYKMTMAKDRKSFLEESILSIGICKRPMRKSALTKLATKFSTLKLLSLLE